ncbi:MAG: hypothetical protein U9Q97_05005 [Acidobacteriota bacterium]|nr:hypothetical protein [Acidobacteriota bacterium]
MKKWDGQTNPPNINLTTCETLAFPNQEEEGWRFTGLLSAMKEKITGMFYCIPEKRNIEHTKILYESEYLNVKKCPQKKLPLLIETLKEKNAIELLEKRLKGNPDATT